MKVSRCFTRVASIIFVICVNAAPNYAKSAENPHQKPGEGIVCLWALVSFASEVGKNCPGKNDPAFQADLERGVEMLDDYVRDNGHVNANAIIDFKRKYGGVGQNTAVLCKNDHAQIYDAFRSQGAEKFLDSIRQSTSRPGVPTSGDCL